MLFCSQQFLVFFVAFLAVYWAIPWHRGRVWLLLAGSVYFYLCWNAWLALVVVGSTTLDYFLARGIEALRTDRSRRVLVAVSVTANLGLLCWFKYADFFLASLEQALRSAGLSVSAPVLKILVPIGISFYTFEAISYIVDVYRGRIRAERNLINLLVFVLFFPHLVAGPIVRARHFLPQVRRRKRWDWPRVQLGVQFFLMGLFKKWVIADQMALFADPVFADPGAYRAGPQWIAVLAYALQIYGDFSGYSDMAIGAAHLLGYRLAQNFNMPYLATSIAEFWHRWHISLSTWLRDYLFIPLGGSRGGRWATCRNLLVTMTLGGLWHGASWTFVVWGMLHGFLLIGHRLFREFAERRPRVEALLQTAPGTALCTALTFLCVAIGWVFFRAQSFTAASALMAGLVTPHRGLRLPIPLSCLWHVLAIVLTCHLLARTGLWQRIAARLPAPALGVAYCLGLTVCLLLAPLSEKTFIYFQF